jgi:hypothetical protein
MKDALTAWGKTNELPPLLFNERLSGAAKRLLLRKHLGSPEILW